jgi:TnpA family transposase
MIKGLFVVFMKTIWHWSKACIYFILLNVYFSERCLSLRIPSLLNTKRTGFVYHGAKFISLPFTWISNHYHMPRLRTIRIRHINNYHPKFIICNILWNVRNTIKMISSVTTGTFQPSRYIQGKISSQSSHWW